MNNNNYSGAFLKTIILMVLICALPIVPFFVQNIFFICICIIAINLFYGLSQSSENNVQLYKETGKKYFNDSNYNNALYYYNKVPEKFRNKDWYDSVTLIKYGIELSNQCENGKSYEQVENYDQALQLYNQVLKEIYVNNLTKVFNKIKSEVLNSISSLCISSIYINNENYTKIIKSQLNLIRTNTYNNKSDLEIIDNLNNKFNNEFNISYPNKIHLLEDNYLNIIEKGNQGENLVYKETENLQNVYKILRNVNIKFDYKTERWDPKSTKGNQMDEVVIGKKGIFILEVKNWKSANSLGYNSKNQLITITSSNKKYRNEEVENQIKNHRLALKTLLESNGIDFSKTLADVHCWLTNANKNSSVDNSIKNTINIFDVNNIGFKIENFMSNSTNAFSDKELKRIYEIINNNQIKEAKYDNYVFNKNYLQYLIETLDIIK